MPWLIQILLLAIFLIAGNFAAAFFHIPLPGSVMGMLMLLLLLVTNLIKLEWIEKAASFQIKHMTLLFIPFVIGLFLSPNFIPLLNFHFLLVLVLSSFCCLLGTAYSVLLYENIRRRRQK
ncbi:CidA/LrgA family protein [Cytobacillus oceanisediminis]|uniref:CidA/LrgA family protein n=1 Tax=Bacillaceae TaxID=186817 RepID=UPI0006500189|nr:murein hydrolase transporter LrgA [Cytobacillus firmus]MCC3645197.1 CidA/LrgA family protein [Cytobacillus oceanisediminis]